ncbi:hypothetical protein AC482_07245 [miscellaneous Crenarchaeota group-15 archaeon DG-45]|uniref:DUF917 domain-containing protein n=1 Tax=miscellaneous Crenarchaeota group-15 archaeon DG-45 TaxID=1685127 RepID=A0A0M0BL28_9ARCH|nr:MAG: hypothetical protein AC482_07245 [miscellaneous Crenarchaeota group-15 archaeon DG-45]
MVDVTEVDDSKMLCILSGVGGGVPPEVREKVAPYRDKVQLGPDARLIRLRAAARELSMYIGSEFYSYIASETGGGNGVLPMYLNALEGKISVDADCCGRAKPEMGLSLTNAAGIPVTPLTMISPFMEVVILKSSVDDYRAEDIARNVAVACGGGITVARCPASMKDYKRGIVPNQVTKCIRIGRAIREAKEGGLDVRSEFVKTSDAVSLLDGSWGDWHIEGMGRYSGHRMRVWFKNENLISWLDGESHIMCPDLICIVEKEGFEGTSNFVPDGNHDGKTVHVFGLKAHENWGKPEGLEIFTPKHFGYDIPYRPMEEILACHS